jgi:hypothetical protein
MERKARTRGKVETAERVDSVMSNNKNSNTFCLLLRAPTDRVIQIFARGFSFSLFEVNPGNAVLQFEILGRSVKSPLVNEQSVRSHRNCSSEGHLGRLRSEVAESKAFGLARAATC